MKNVIYKKIVSYHYIAVAMPDAVKLEEDFEVNRKLKIGEIRKKEAELICKYSRPVKLINDSVAVHTYSASEEEYLKIASLTGRVNKTI